MVVSIQSVQKKKLNKNKCFTFESNRFAKDCILGCRFFCPWKVQYIEHIKDHAAIIGHLEKMNKHQQINSHASKLKYISKGAK